MRKPQLHATYWNVRCGVAIFGLCAIAVLASACESQFEEVETSVERASVLDETSELARDGLSPPSSIEELVADGRDLIVIGNVIGPVSTATIPIDGSAYPGPTTEPEAVTDLEITVDTILLDKFEKIGSPPFFMLRVTTGNTYPTIDEDYLFIASYNMDEPGSTFSSVFDAKDWIKANTTPVQYADGEYVPYANGMTFAEFVEAIQDELD